MVNSGANGILAANITLSVLAAVAVSLRIFARRKKALSLQSDDWTIVASLVSRTPWTTSDMMLIV